jgi:type IV secretory pathway TrbD component
MKTVRLTPRAINQPLLILGVERGLAVFLFVASSMIAMKINRPVGIALFVIAWAAIRKMTRKDPHALQIWAVLFRMKPLYDAIKRNPVRVEITE